MSFYHSEDIADPNKIFFVLVFLAVIACYPTIWAGMFVFPTVLFVLPGFNEAVGIFLECNLGKETSPLERKSRRTGK
jgi:hypothetical protein